MSAAGLSAQAVISGPPDLIAGAVYGEAPSEGLAFEGDEPLARRFLTLFTLPPKAATP